MKTLAHPGDHEELCQRLEALRQDSARRWGRMSAHQMVCHLTDAFLLGMGERPVSQADNLLTRTIVKRLALYSPIPWPRGITTRPEVDQLGGGTRPVDFASDIAQAEAQMARFLAHKDLLHRTPHPFFGAMSNGDWLRWGYLHPDHHLRQFGA